MLQIPCVSEMFPRNGLEDSCHWTGRERTTLEAVPAISNLRTFWFFFFSERSYFRCSPFSRISILCSNSSQRPPRPLVLDRGKFPVCCPWHFPRSKFKIKIFAVWFTLLQLASRTFTCSCSGLFEILEEDFGRGMVFGLASFGVGAFLGGFVVVGYGGFCRWDFSVWEGGLVGLVHGVWTCPATHLHHNSRPSISSPSFLSPQIPRRLGPIEQSAIALLNPSIPPFNTVVWNAFHLHHTPSAFSQRPIRIVVVLAGVDVCTVCEREGRWRS